MLRIRVTNFKGQALPSPIERIFGPDGGSIGREPTNLLILPDPARLVSRTHAHIRCEGGSYSLTDTGRNPLFVNGQALGPGQAVRLKDGDLIRIGEYELEAVHDAGATIWNEPPASAASHGLNFATAGKAGDWEMPGGDVPRGENPHLDALRDGLGLPEQELSPEELRLIGRLLRETVGGLLGLLRARADVKQGLQAEVTVLSSRRNNPLKFVREEHLALVQLLSPPLRGFMPAEEAVRDAVDDLHSHHFGVVAGMQAALAGLLDRFTPAELERQLGPHMVLDLLPMHRRARLWDTFQAKHGEIRREAEENFHSIFGREFLRAYEEKIQELDTAAASRGRSHG